MTRPPRVALVTGGAVRLGRAIVEELSRGGWSVAFTYRTSELEARELVETLSHQNLTATAFHADLDDPAARGSLIDEVTAALGGLDALVNSAGIFPRTPLAELDVPALTSVMLTNFEAPLFLSLAAASALRERSGAIVNIADVYALRPLRHHLAYSVSKAALVAATRALAVELAPEVRVNAIAPGIAMFPDSYDEAKRARLLARTLLPREVGGAEIARAVRYLIEDASMVTGQVLVIDGGQTLTW